MVTFEDDIFLCQTKIQFLMKVLIFSSHWQVSVSPVISSDFTLTPLTGAQQASCLCAKGRRTDSWKLTPTALGEG